MQALITHKPMAGDKKHNSNSTAPLRHVDSTAGSTKILASCQIDSLLMLSKGDILLPAQRVTPPHRFFYDH